MDRHVSNIMLLFIGIRVALCYSLYVLREKREWVEDCKPYFKGTEADKNCLTFLCLPLFPSCVYQSFSNIPSMSSGSLCSHPRAQLMASFRSFSLSCECTLKFNISDQHWDLGLSLTCSIGWGLFCVWWMLWEVSGLNELDAHTSSVIMTTAKLSKLFHS